jgi:hypothetical protein
MRQVETSRTLVFDAPRHARAFFEALVTDNLDIGRPDLHHSTGYDVTVDASGASLGPTALVRTPQITSQGNLTGGINGRTVDFTINWSGTKAYVHFTGTVGNDGIAHGTSTGLGTPVKLDPGPWDSITRLTC